MIDCAVSVFQVKSHLYAPGKTVKRGLQGQMSSQGIGGPTLERSDSHAPSVCGGSCAVTTWPSTLGATQQLPRKAGWEKTAQQMPVRSTCVDLLAAKQPIKFVCICTEVFKYVQ